MELEQPRQALDRAGAQTTLLSIKTGEIAARNHDLEDAGTFPVDRCERILQEFAKATQSA